jgi:hypothetical protein
MDHRAAGWPPPAAEWATRHLDITLGSIRAVGRPPAVRGREMPGRRPEAALSVFTSCSSGVLGLAL